MKTVKIAPNQNIQKRQIFINLKKPYDALKIDCAIRGNIGALEKRFLGGGHPGTLNAKQDLIDLIAACGGNFLAVPGFTPAINGQLRRAVGTGYVGWVDFGTRAAADNYLSQYFALSFCATGSSNMAGRPSAKTLKSKQARPSTGDLENIGFLNDGQWEPAQNKNGQSTLKDVGDDPNEWAKLIARDRALYAFCDDQEVLYIGKTAQTINKRFVGYRNPGKGQATNSKCHREIERRIGRKRTIRILVFPDPSMLFYGSFSINLAAGLEDALVAHFQPPLNGMKTSSLDNEILAQK